MVALGWQGYWRARERDVVLLVGTEMFQRDTHALCIFLVAICK